LRFRKRLAAYHYSVVLVCFDYGTSPSGGRRIREDNFRNGKLYRVFRRIRIAPSKTNKIEAQKLADEILDPLNKGLISIGSGTNFRNYVETTYIPLIMPLLASTTQGRYRGVLNNYLLPTFGNLSFRDLTTMSLQRYFSQMATSPLAYESRDKIRDIWERKRCRCAHPVRTQAIRMTRCAFISQAGHGKVGRSKHSWVG
jgi:hypothetical protein